MGFLLLLPFLLQASILSTVDLKAVAHILNHNYTYRKSPELRYEFSLFIGDGLVGAEGDDHKRQRKILNPAFGLGPIREMTKVFVEKSIELRDELDKLLDGANAAGLETGTSETKKTGEKDSVETDMVSWISRWGLDVIGLTGFNYSFNSLSSPSSSSSSSPSNRSLSSSELYSALEAIFTATQLGFLLLFFKVWIPWLRWWKLDSTSRKLKRGHDIIKRIGKELIEEKVQAIKEGGSDGKEKDLLTLLIKANLEESNPKKRMTEWEVINQIPTFIIAGTSVPCNIGGWYVHPLPLSFFFLSFFLSRTRNHRYRDRLDATLAGACTRRAGPPPGGIADHANGNTDDGRTKLADVP